MFAAGAFGFQRPCLDSTPQGATRSAPEAPDFGRASHHASASQGLCRYRRTMVAGPRRGSCRPCTRRAAPPATRSARRRCPPQSRRLRRQARAQSGLSRQVVRVAGQMGRAFGNDLGGQLYSMGSGMAAWTRRPRSSASNTPRSSPRRGARIDLREGRLDVGALGEPPTPVSTPVQRLASNSPSGSCPPPPGPGPHRARPVATCLSAVGCVKGVCSGRSPQEADEARSRARGSLGVLSGEFALRARSLHERSRASGACLCGRGLEPARTDRLGTSKIGFAAQIRAGSASSPQTRSQSARFWPEFRATPASDFGLAVPNLREAPCAADPQRTEIWRRLVARTRLPAYARRKRARSGNSIASITFPF